MSRISILVAITVLLATVVTVAAQWGRGGHQGSYYNRGASNQRPYYNYNRGFYNGYQQGYGYGNNYQQYQRQYPGYGSYYQQNRYAYAQPTYYGGDRDIGGGVHVDSHGNGYIGPKDTGLYIFCASRGCVGRG